MDDVIGWLRVGPARSSLTYNEYSWERKARMYKHITLLSSIFFAATSFLFLNFIIFFFFLERERGGGVSLHVKMYYYTCIIFFFVWKTSFLKKLKRERKRKKRKLWSIVTVWEAAALRTISWLWLSSLSSLNNRHCWRPFFQVRRRHRRIQFDFQERQKERGRNSDVSSEYLRSSTGSVPIGFFKINNTRPMNHAEERQWRWQAERNR